MPLDEHPSTTAAPSPAPSPTTAPDLLSPGALDLIRRGVSVIVATRDAAHCPQIARGWGPEALSPSGPLRVCVETRAGSHTVESLLLGAPIAMTLTRPSTYRSLQVKGAVAAIEAPTEGQLARVDDHWMAYAAEAELVGVSARLVSRLVDRQALLTVTVDLEEAYDQTPGPRAGVRL